MEESHKQSWEMINVVPSVAGAECGHAAPSGAGSSGVRKGLLVLVLVHVGKVFEWVRFEV